MRFVCSGKQLVLIWFAYSLEEVRLFVEQRERDAFIDFSIEMKMGQGKLMFVDQRE